MTGLEFLNLLVWFTAVVMIVYFFVERLQSSMAEVRQSQAVAANATFQDLYIMMSPETFFFLRMSGTILAFFLGVFIFNWALGAFLAGAAFWVPGVLLTRMRRKRVFTIEQQLVEALELMGNALKSGLTLPQAVELLVKEFPPPISQEFTLVLAENRLGVDFTDAVGNMARRLDSTIVSVLATGVAIVKKCGGDLTVIFQNIANVIREQAHIDGKLKSVTAQGRFQGLILSVMPFALMIILWFIDRAHVETLFGYSIGLGAVAAVVLMVILANVWIAKLLDIDV